MRLKSGGPLMTVLFVDADPAWAGHDLQHSPAGPAVDHSAQIHATARCTYYDGMRRIKDTFGIKTLVRISGAVAGGSWALSEEERKKESAIKDIGRDEALRKRVGYMATAQLETESNVRKLERDVAAIGADVAVIRAEKPSAAGLAGTVRKLWKRLSLLEERKNL